MGIDKDEYVQLAQFRSAIRRFLRFSEKRAQAAGLTPQQHQLLLAIKETPDRDWARPAASSPRPSRSGTTPRWG